ncbi:MAG: hypothetical protein E7378_01715 [Clostridiales bacterium]|nr:hypothetical protein [Clostridiales bacterium]
MEKLFTLIRERDELLETLFGANYSAETLLKHPENEALYKAYVEPADKAIMAVAHELTGKKYTKIHDVYTCQEIRKLHNASKETLEK